jgi:AcrR family transcriptional regulator
VTIVSSTDTRVRNRRGEGARLRDDIVAAAGEILEAAGNPEAVTLRAIARRVGISAPSIYGHFADREAIVDAVVAGGFAALTRAVESAIAGSDDPAERLRLGCGAYLRFGDEHPQVYQAMFACNGTIATDRAPIAVAAGAEAFGVLVEGIRDAAARGRSTSTDPYLDGVATWVALHGMSTLMANLPGFAWPDRDVLLGHLVERLTRLR